MNTADTVNVVKLYVKPFKTPYVAEGRGLLDKPTSEQREAIDEVMRALNRAYYSGLI